jgi:hypothetical protein
LGSEEDDFVELGEVGEEVVYAWSLDSLPAFGALKRLVLGTRGNMTYVPSTAHEQPFKVNHEGVWALMRSGKWIREQLVECWLVEVLEVRA